MPSDSRDMYYASLLARTVAVEKAAASINRVHKGNKKLTLDMLESAVKCIDNLLSSENCARNDMLSQLEMLIDNTLSELQLAASQALSEFRRGYISQLEQISQGLMNTQEEAPTQDHNIIVRHTLAEAEKIRNEVNATEEKIAEQEKTAFASVLALESVASGAHMKPYQPPTYSDVLFRDAVKKDEQASYLLRDKLMATNRRLQALIARRQEAETAFYKTIEKLVQSVETAICLKCSDSH